MVSDKPFGNTLREKLDGKQPSWNSGTHYLSYAAEFISNFLRKVCQKIYVIYSAEKELQENMAKGLSSFSPELSAAIDIR